MEPIYVVGPAVVALMLTGYFLGRVRDKEQGVPRGPGFWNLHFYFCRAFKLGCR